MGQALDAAGVDDGSPDAGADTDAGDLSVDASSASSDPSTSDAAPADATPTASPQQAEPPSTGPIPYHRHKAVLDKAYAERDTLKAEVEAVAWAKQVPPEVGPKLVEMARRVQGDPVGFLVELANEVQNDPRHAASIKSYAARLLANRRPAPAEPPAVADDPMPTADIVVDGHRWYSEARQAERDQWFAKRLAAELGGVVDERLAPFRSITERVAEGERQQQATQAAEAFATREFTAVSKLPGFLDHRAAIADRFAAEMAKFPEHEQDAHAAVVLRDVYHAIVLPTLTKASADTVRQTLTAKAVAGSLGARPTSANGVSRPTSMAEALANAGF